MPLAASAAPIQESVLPKLWFAKKRRFTAQIPHILVANKSVWTPRCDFAKVYASRKLILVPGLEQMRFFSAACVTCILVATLGCVTNNWSSAPFANTEERGARTEFQKTVKSFWNSKFGELSGSDPRSREIEKRLGY